MAVKDEAAVLKAVDGFQEELEVSAVLGMVRSGPHIRGLSAWGVRAGSCEVGIFDVGKEEGSEGVEFGKGESNAQRNAETLLGCCDVGNGNVRPAVEAGGAVSIETGLENALMVLQVTNVDRDVCSGIAAGIRGGRRGSKGSRVNGGVKRGAVLRFSSGYGEGSKLGKDWDTPEGVGGGSAGDRECGGMRRASKAMIQMSGLWEGGCWCWYRTRCPVGRRHMGANVWFFRAPCLRELYAWTSRSFVFSSIPTTFPKKRFYVSGTSQMIISP
uniref:Uncharacterized protein n=1 Tax=Chromera velia CCMP2878 TaxID=1169474 RepID=A0A0G4HBE7_9ALVE|eukprot:Cvel_25946.t1-p1 / transcript=Cvel_25946.t1 / gene=Cvel_25946 / organism=Chromera_velia_CCMP2878 / gene_product=hypothetical protein / transcript_product=hypothetical protein / location=Cvel_scaffold3006:9338-10322(+) / protein_length=270 / sequence_SO=supercontig / SO=protein_coding / is_pseudo=false